MERTVNQVIEKISQILVNFCNEEENINNWKKEFEWFVEIDKNKHTKYWNLAPEYIELLKWQQLSNIMNMFILFDGPHNEWETMIIDVFLNKDKQSNISYPFIDEYSSVWFSDNTIGIFGIRFCVISPSSISPSSISPFFSPNF